VCVCVCVCGSCQLIVKMFDCNSVIAAPAPAPAPVAAAAAAVAVAPAQAQMPPDAARPAPAPAPAQAPNPPAPAQLPANVAMLVDELQLKPKQFIRLSEIVSKAYVNDSKNAHRHGDLCLWRLPTPDTYKLSSCSCAFPRHNERVDYWCAHLPQGAVLGMCVRVCVCASVPLLTNELVVWCQSLEPKPATSTKPKP
jgi:hypothetical protein